MHHDIIVGAMKKKIVVFSGTLLSVAVVSIVLLNEEAWISLI